MADVPLDAGWDYPVISIEHPETSIKFPATSIQNHSVFHQIFELFKNLCNLNYSQTFIKVGII